MAVLYKTVRSILANKAGVKVFYPRVVLKGHVSTDQIAREISEYSSLSKGDTKNVIDNLVRVLTTHLQSSESVTLDGFGTCVFCPATRRILTVRRRPAPW